MKTRLLLLLALLAGAFQMHAQMPCNANFTFTVNPGGVATFTATPGTTTTMYLWDFGNGSTGSGQIATTVYNTLGAYTVCLTVIDTSFLSPCIDSNCVTITIGSSSGCLASFTPFNTGGTIYQYGVTNSSIGSGLTYTWNWGDGSPNSNGPNPLHTYASSGTYTICLYIDDGAGCTDTACNTITVGSTLPCNASFVLTPNNAPTSLPYTYDATSTSTGTGLSYVWTWGDGTPNSTGANPTHVFPAPGTYYVCLAISNSMGCVDSFCQNITVTSTPPAGCQSYFYIYPDTSFGAPASTYIGVNASTGTGLQYLWLWGDGNTSTGPYPSHTYASPGNYVICLIVDNGSCRDTFCNTYLINKTSSMYTVNFQAPTSVSGVSELTEYVYPNPAMDKFTLKGLPGNQYNLQLIDLNGRQLLQQSVKTSDLIHIDHLPAGIYLIKLRDTQGQTIIQRLVKQ